MSLGGLSRAPVAKDGLAIVNRNKPLMQFQADILGVPVVSSKNHRTAMGAAYLAGLDVGYFRSTGEISSQWKPGETFIPRMSQDRRESLRSG